MVELDFSVWIDISACNCEN